MNAAGSKELNPNAGGGSLERLVLRRDPHRLKSAPATISNRAPMAGDATALRTVLQAALIGTHKSTGVIRNP
jgi:hypothetical protein